MDLFVNLLVKLISKLEKSDKKKYGVEITDEDTFKRYLKKSLKLKKRKKIKFFILTIANICFFIYIRKYDMALIISLLIEGLLTVGVLMYIDTEDDCAEMRYSKFISEVAVRSILPNATFKGWVNRPLDEFIDNRVIMYGVCKLVSMNIRDNTQGQEFEYFNLRVDSPYHSKLTNKDSTITTFDGSIIKTRIGRGIEQGVRIITSDKEVTGEKIYNWPGQRDDEQKVDVENIIFNETFEVYASNYQDAFVILSPYVTEKILELQKLYSKFSIVVKGDYLYIAIKQRNGLLTIPDMSTKEAIDEISIEREVERIKYLVEFTRDINSYISGKL